MTTAEQVELQIYELTKRHRCVYNLWYKLTNYGKLLVCHNVLLQLIFSWMVLTRPKILYFDLISAAY